MSIGKRIKQKRNELNLTQDMLARKIQVSNVAISHWESDETKPNANNSYNLSKILKCDLSWLLNGNSYESNVATIHIDGIKIPLISFKQAIDWNNEKLHTLKVEYIMSSLDISIQSFALRLIDDSMLPSFAIDDIVIIDPDITPAAGEFVLAIQNGCVLFRKFKIDTSIGDFSLIPLNQDYPIIYSIDSSINIIGTMVEHRIYRRKR